MLWVIVLVLLLVSFAGSPSVGYWNHGYGWAPSGIGGFLIIILVVLLLTGRI